MIHAFHRFHFTGQRDGEEVVEIIHRHWFDILSRFIFILFFSSLLLSGFIFLFFLFPDFLNISQKQLFLFLENTFFLFIWLFGFLTWIDYYFDTWIITNERIVNIEQRGLFDRHISELNFRNIQDVTTSVDGILPTILNFGDVSIQTAAEQERFMFRMVPDPYKIKDIIMKRTEHTRSSGLH
ncbi:MAG: PH domain-containing protein [Candidatus Moranbacteria bacterium]|nr:PH domain-containing protein [Candidatus Moranbacteria bacterium]MDD3964604.1 PH domain-containing protein [Candidatus Moranbacteria bacterium]